MIYRKAFSFLNLNTNNHKIYHTMKLELTTPALLFSTVSLLILAFSNRFISIAQLIRTLHDKYKQDPDYASLLQINKLRKRARIIRDMQIIAVSSLLLSVVTMFLLFYDLQDAAQIVFSASLILLGVAMSLSIAEMLLSTNALNLLLDGEEESKEKNNDYFRKWLISKYVFNR